MADEGYLSARPAEYDLDPRIKHENQQGRPEPSNGHKQRFDSGVGDLEMHRISTMSRPKSSMYEYIDTASHYEDIPGHMGRSVSQMPNGSDDMRKSIVSDSRSVVTDVTTDTEDTATIFRTSIDKKRRYNPLYAPNAETTPSSFERRKKQKQVDGIERHLCVQCAFLIIICLLAMAALAIGLYLIFFQVLDYNNSMMERIQSLEENNKRLSQENEELKIIVTAAGFNTSLLKSPLINMLRNTSKAVLTFEDELSSLNNQILFTQQNLSKEISDLGTSVDTKLLNISKMPGPPGPPGVGNLSACEYKKYTTSSAPSSDSFETAYWPKIETLKKQIVMSATCTIQGGTTSFLQIASLSLTEEQYKCVCSGQSGQQDRQCRLHMLICPRET